MGLKEFLQLKWFVSACIPNIPAFQHSILPFWQHKQVAINNHVFSGSCRIFETPKYDKNI